MTVTTAAPRTTEPSPPPRRRWRVVAVIAAAALAAGGLGAGLVLSLGGSSTPTGTRSSSAYSYYQSMMGRFGFGSMMGGSSSSMMGPSGYSWMMGGTGAPGWMNGGSLPGFMMRSSTDPGEVMGQLFANAPGPRVSPAQATGLGNEVPPGASVDRAAKRITFSDRSVSLAVVASPAGNPDETFRVAGLVNPTIVVPLGAQIRIELVNTDPDTAHGLVATTAGAANSWMPMMTASPAFSGSALWFLGNPTSAGMHEGNLSFIANRPGTYQYLCPVPGHAQKGMVGTLAVS